MTVHPAVRLSVLAANIESRTSSPELARLIEQHQPDVVVVEQAYRARAWLAGIDGYKHRQYKPRKGAEWHGIAILVRRGVAIKRRQALVMKRDWTGPKADKRHEPRVYPALVLSKDGVTFRVLGIHWPTHNNLDAQAESRHAVADYFAAHPDSPVIAAGDYNAEARELEALAVTCGAELLPAGKVDHALVRNVKHRVTRRLPKPEFAHGWALFIVEATKENS